MKLDWRINNCRVLVAEAGAVTYYVAPDVISLWKPKKYSTVSEGKVEAEGAVYGMSLTNAIAWCERDAERPEECPVQPPAAGPAATKTSDGVPKFPNTLDASVWASRATAWFGAFKVPDLTEWFDAALARGYREGREDKQDLLGCFTPHQLHNMASGGKSNQAAELLEAEEAGRRLTLNQHRAWYRMNAASPSTQVPEPPSVEDRLARLEARQEAEDRAGLVAQLPGLYDKVGRLSLELCMLPVDRLRDMARRIAELETKQKADDEIRFNQIQALSLRASSDEIKMSGGFERLKRRLDGLEAKLPRTGDASLGTMHEEVCKRLGDLEERAQWSPDSRLVEERLMEFESRLVQLVTSKCQALDHRINSAIAQINRELGELRASVQTKSNVLHDHKATLSFHDKRLEKLEART